MIPAIHISSHLGRPSVRRLYALSLLAVCAALGLPQAWATAAPTTTSLAITSSGSAVTSVAAGTVVTLTATVVSGSTPVNPGQVKFCIATAAHCEDSALLATAQLTTAGKATFKFRPGLGSHSYQAVFAGTKSYAKSSSTTPDLAVTGLYPTTTTIASSGSIGDYTLTATITGPGTTTVFPTGSVSFVDTNNSNVSLGKATLGTATLAEDFTASSVTGVGNGPYGIAVGDFNGDGIPDVATANDSGNTVSVLLGNGDGTFTLKSSPNAGDYRIDSIAVGDFNGDGILDLAVTNDSLNIPNGSVTVLLGNGDGTFTTKSTISAGAGPDSIAVGDFNGDGIPDLAVAVSYEGTVRILLGNGDGTFSAGFIADVGGFPQSIAMGDFNGDGTPDLATGGYDDSSVSVLLGNGDGTFTATSSSYVGVGDSPRSITVGDFDGDGIPDLAVAMEIYPVGSTFGFGAVAVLLGNGDGTFTAKSTPSTGGQQPSSITVCDFNGDGIADLAVIDDNLYVATTATVLLGNGDGTFTIQSSASVNNYSTLAVGDFNGDGFPDLATANIFANTVTVLLNQITETATATLSGVSVHGSETHQVEASYPGDTNYNSSSSTAVTLLTAQVTTTLSLSSSLNPSIPANPVTLTATLSPYSAGDLTSNGEKVTFYNGGTSIGAGTLSSGVTTLNIVPLPTGTYTLTAAYAGDGNFAAAVSNSIVEIPAATPTLSLPSGTFTNTTLTITDTMAGATIYYTLHGTMPTTSSAVYTQPIVFNDSGTFTVEAIAVASGYSNSAVATAVYTIHPYLARPTFSPPAGGYTTPQTVTISDISTKTIYYTTDGSMATTSSPLYSGPITVSSNETINAIAVLSGFTNSPEATAAYTFGPQTSTPIFSLPSGTYENPTLTITDATAGAVIHYSTDGSTPTTDSDVYTKPILFYSSGTFTVKAIAVASGPNSAVVTAVYTIQPVLARPSFTPQAGSYTTPQTVTISDVSTKTIYYTTDGSMPTTSSMLYSGPITVSSNQTINAIAVLSGFTNSPEATAAYTIEPQAPTPTLSLPSGPYPDFTSLTITDATAGAVIHYSTNGSTPTTSSDVYTKPIVFYNRGTFTVKAIAVASGYLQSAAATAAYTIGSP